MEQELESRSPAGAPNDAYIIGHAADPGLTSTGPRLPGAVVPPGRTVHFYAALGENLSGVSVAAILADGRIPPVQSYHGGDTLPNYQFDVANDADILEALSSASSLLDGRIYVLGEPPLTTQTTDDSLFLHDPAGACADERHVAGCRCLFARITSPVLHLLTCRGAPADGATPSPSPVRTAVAMTPTSSGISDRHFGKQIRRLAMAILEMARNDGPAVAHEYAQSLPQATFSSLNSVTFMRAWLALMHRPLSAESSDHEIEHAVQLATPCWSFLHDTLHWTTSQVIASRLGGEVVEVTDERRLFAEHDLSVPADFADCWRNHNTILEAFNVWLKDRYRPAKVNAQFRVHRLCDAAAWQIGQPGWDVRLVLGELSMAFDDGVLATAGLRPEYGVEASDLLQLVTTGPSGRSRAAGGVAVRRLVKPHLVSLIDMVRDDVAADLEVYFEIYRDLVLLPASGVVSDDD